MSAQEKHLKDLLDFHESQARTIRAQLSALDYELKELVTFEEAAKFFCVDKKHLANLSCSKKITVVTINKERFIFNASILAHYKNTKRTKKDRKIITLEEARNATF